MTLHWWHVALSWVAVLGGFAGAALMISARARAARRRLARLESAER
ncbi:hypothetical protein [Rhodovarius lipocyclicus]|nr:hypothetical protein [Rhodovarius lipocyclicus]